VDRQARAGWAYQEAARLTLDLGQSQPLGQVSCACRSSARTTRSQDRHGVAQPRWRHLLAGVQPLGQDPPGRQPGPDLRAPAHRSPGIYAVVLNLGYEARYVRLDVALQGIMVTDELAILPAARAVRPLPAARRVSGSTSTTSSTARPVPEADGAGNLLLGKVLRYALNPATA